MLVCCSRVFLQFIVLSDLVYSKEGKRKLKRQKDDGDGLQVDQSEKKRGQTQKAQEKETQGTTKNMILSEIAPRLGRQREQRKQFQKANHFDQRPNSN